MITSTRAGGLQLQLQDSSPGWLSSGFHGLFPSKRKNGKLETPQITENRHRIITDAFDVFYKMVVAVFFIFLIIWHNLEYPQEERTLCVDPSKAKHFSTLIILSREAKPQNG